MGKIPVRQLEEVDREVLQQRIDELQNEARDIDEELDNLESDIRYLRADAALFRQDFETHGVRFVSRPQFQRLSETFIRGLNSAKVEIGNPFWEMREEIRKKKLKPGDEVEIPMIDWNPYFKDDNITKAAANEAEAAELEVRRARLVDKLHFVRSEIDALLLGLKAATVSQHYPLSQNTIEPRSRIRRQRACKGVQVAETGSGLETS